jgi:hypothetical protein
MSNQPSSLNALLHQQLTTAQQLDQQANAEIVSGTMVEIPSTGKTVTNAYEQLRNAAEYAEEHLLLQKAIKRFFKRNLFLTKRQSHALGGELIVELTHAGYLQRTSFSKDTAAKIDEIIEEYMVAFGKLRRARVKYDTAVDWVLAHIATESENILNPHHTRQAIVAFTYYYFLQTLPKANFTDLPDNASYELCVYIAVHQALLKSDIDIVRHELRVLYKQSPKEVAGFKHLNQQIDLLYRSQLTQQLKRAISRYGAPFRVLKGLIDSRPDIAESLPKQPLFMDAYNRQVDHEYQEVQRRLNRGLVKSIVFIFITKVIVGIAVEVPYDILRHGLVAFMPLGINLLFPPLYMASLKLSLRPPTQSNAYAVRTYMENLLYGSPEPVLQVPPRRASATGAKFLYTLLFAVPLAITVFILRVLGFNVVQMIIFFIFFSTASFLVFRLSTLVRDLELTTRQTGLLASLRNFFYLPFIVVGQWLSRKYGKVNAVGHFLDVAIELPLKTILRLLRQWSRFLSEKQEELY